MTLSIFNSAKLKLTGLYLLIIMCVTISFSFFIFSGINQVTEHALEGQRIRIESRIQGMPDEFRRTIPIAPFNVDTLIEIREQVLYNLIIINIVVLVVSGSLGYYLAGKTLKPIEDMIVKQKRFISDAAHELKTPLTAIKTDLEVTLRDKNLDLKEAKEALSRTIEEIDELSAMTTNLLAAGKYNNSDIYTKEIKIFSLDNLISKVVKKFSAKAKEQSIEITEELIPVEIKADQHEIEHVLMNIIDNAIKYSKPDSKVSIFLSEQNKKAIIKVEDEGVGISKKSLSQIFDPFFREDKSRTKSKTEGYGLGLAITKDIVESYGGTISATSETGKGSTFIITLPVGD